MDIWGNRLKSSVITFLAEICFQDTLDVAGNISTAWRSLERRRVLYRSDSIVNIQSPQQGPASFYGTKRQFSVLCWCHPAGPAGTNLLSWLLNKVPSQARWQYWERGHCSCHSCSEEKDSGTYFPPTSNVGVRKIILLQIQWFSTTEVLLLPARGVSIVLKWGEDGWYHTEDWEVVQRMQRPCFSSRVSPGYVAKGQVSNRFKRRWGGLWGSPMQGQKFQLHSLMQLCQISAYST